MGYLPDIPMGVYSAPGEPRKGIGKTGPERSAAPPVTVSGQSHCGSILCVPPGTRFLMTRLPVFAAALFCLAAPAVQAAESEDWSLHGQATFIDQYHPAFRSPYRGANSLDPGSRGNETFDVTLVCRRAAVGGRRSLGRSGNGPGLRPVSNTRGRGGLSQRRGLQGRQGRALFPAAAAVLPPELRSGRRRCKTMDGRRQPARRPAHAPTIWSSPLGKFSVTDIFDTNGYAHDPRGDFLNWALIDAGAFDYAADAWGYSYGVAAEWTQGWWTLRGGLFDLSRMPNTTELRRGFGQYRIGRRSARSGTRLWARTARSSCWASSIAGAWAAITMRVRAGGRRRDDARTPRWCAATPRGRAFASISSSGSTDDLGVFAARQR